MSSERMTDGRLKEIESYLDDFESGFGADDGTEMVRELITEIRRLRSALKKEAPEYLRPPYDPEAGDHSLCSCGHPYYRHFDSYENMLPVGCKYCPCGEFKDGLACL